MKAVILAAGKSTRLYPLTRSLPKSLLPIGEETILDHQIKALVTTGISEAVIVVGCHKQQIVDHLAAKKYPIAISYVENDEYDTSHPITSLWFAHEHLEGPLIFFHCDVLFTADTIKSLLIDPNESTFLYRKGVWDEEAGKIIIGDNQRVLELGKHIESDRATGEYLQIARLDADFCKHLVKVLTDRHRDSHDGFTIDAFNDVIQDDTIRATGLPFDGFAMEIDTVEDYEAAKEAWDKKTS